MCDFKEILKLDKDKIVLIILAYVVFIFMGELKGDKEEMRKLQDERAKLNISMIHNINRISENISANTNAINALTNRVQTVETALIYKSEE